MSATPGRPAGQVLPKSKLDSLRLPPTSYLPIIIMLCAATSVLERLERESVAKTTITIITMMSLMRRAQFDDILCSFAMGLYRRYHTHTRAGRPRLGELSSGSSGGLVREC